MSVQPEQLDDSPNSASPFRNTGDEINERVYDAESIDTRDLDPDRHSGGQITKKDAKEHGGKWPRLRKLDEELITWEKGDDFDRDAYLNGRTVTRDDRHGRMYKVHRVATTCQRLGIEGATENRARRLIAAFGGDGEGRGHEIEKQIAGALIVARDEFVVTRLARLANEIDGPIADELQRLNDVETVAARWRFLNVLPNLTDHEGVHSALAWRLTSIDSFAEWVEAEGVNVENAVLNLGWDDVR